MTRLPLRAISVLLLSALMLPGCSSVKPMLSGSERKKRKVTKETPARIESHAPESRPDESQPIGDIDELGEKHADAAPVLLPMFPDKNRPEMTFGDLESANVRIPLKYNNPFPSSGELSAARRARERVLLPVSGQAHLAFRVSGKPHAHRHRHQGGAEPIRSGPRFRASSGCRNTTAATAIWS